MVSRRWSTTTTAAALLALIVLVAAAALVAAAMTPEEAAEDMAAMRRHMSLKHSHIASPYAPSDASTYQLPATHRTAAIEYAVARDQIAFWVAPTIVQAAANNGNGHVSDATAGPLLMTFGRDSSAAAVVAAFNDLFGADDCALTGASGAVAMHAPMRERLFDPSNRHRCRRGDEHRPEWRLRVTCRERSIRSEMHPFAAPPLPPANYRSGQTLWPADAVDVAGDSWTGIWDYFSEFMANHFGDLHPFNTYPAGQSGRYWLSTGQSIPPDWSGATLSSASQPDWLPADWGSDTTVRVAMTADWGSGTYESQIVSDLLIANYDPHYTVHLGDVYYVGEEAEVKAKCLGIPPDGVTNGVKWSHGSIGSFSFNGNHEMYSRGYGYFDTFLPTLGIYNTTTGEPSGQQASYLSLENEYWRLIGLDTGYFTYGEWKVDNPNNMQPQAVIDWLNETVRLWDPNDKRGVVLLSHHQYFSAFDDQVEPSLDTPMQIQALLPPHRKVLWLWGHEHRLAFYGLMSAGNMTLEAYGRCIGVGGFPVQLSPIPSGAARYNLTAFDDRTYVTLNGIHSTAIGFNGFSHLNLTGPVLTIDYRSTRLQPDGSLSATDSDVLVTERWTVDGATGDVVMDSFDVVNPNVTIVHNL